MSSLCFPPQKIIVSSLPHLVEDVIIEILLRLPVKSLLRFTSVCRQWRKIITSSRFEREQFHRGREISSRVFYWNGSPGNHDCEFDSCLDPAYECVCDITIDEAKVCSLLPGETTLQRYEGPDLDDNCVVMCGPCNGIICVANSRRMLVLWNPTTRRSRLLPPCPLVTSESEIGFGVDPITDDLKIVLFDRKCNQRQCAVYNSRNDSWQLLEAKAIFKQDLKFYVMHNSWGGCPFLNGFCYWMKHIVKHDLSKTYLLVFDMHRDLFQEIEMPETDCETSLGLFDDKLALISYDIDARHTDIWLMKELGCWTKHSVVVVPFDSIYPIGIWKRNQICRWKDDELIIHDLDSGHTIIIGFGRLRGIRNVIFHPCLYKESLVSV